MTEQELRNIETAAQAVVNNPAARSADERRAAARELCLCAEVRRLGGHVAVVKHERNSLREERDRLQARIAELERGRLVDTPASYDALTHALVPRPGRRDDS